MRASPCAPGGGEQAAAVCPAPQPWCAHSCSAHPPCSRTRHGGSGGGRERGCAAMLRPVSSGSRSRGVSPPACLSRGTNVLSHPVSEQSVCRVEVQWQTFVCIYLLAATKDIIPALPTCLLFLIHWEQTGHLSLFLGLFWFSGSSLLTTFSDFPVPCSQPTGEVGLLSLPFFR